MTRNLFFALLLLLTGSFAAVADDDWNILRIAREAYEQGNYQKVHDLLTPLAERGQPRALHMIGHLHAKGLLGKKDEGLAYQHWLKSAAAGERQSLYALGVFYENGQHVQQNLAKAMEHYLAAAQKNHPQAMYRAGLFYKLGQGVTQDHSAARDWFEEAANWGVIDAHNQMAAYYQRGIGGIEKNPKGVFHWRKRAADKEDPPSERKVGLYYLTGYGIFQSDAKAFHWIHLSAEHGDLEAQYLLAELFQNGTGTEKNERMARSWYRRAHIRLTRKEHLNAGENHALGMMLIDGKGGETDPARAYRHLLDAAKQGQGASFLSLSKLAMEGIGNHQDPIEAAKWLYIPAMKGSQKAKAILTQQVLPNLTKQEKEEAKERASAWIKRHKGDPSPKYR